MLRNSFIVLLLICSNSLSAQDINFHISLADVQSGTSKSVSQVYTYIKLDRPALNDDLFHSVWDGAMFGGKGIAFLSGNFSTRVTVNGTQGPLGNLSRGWQTIMRDVEIKIGDSFSIEFAIKNPNACRWIAGLYSARMELARNSSSAYQYCTLPRSQGISLTVDPFIQLESPVELIMEMNDFKFFRREACRAQGFLGVWHSIPFTRSIKNNLPAFDYRSSGYQTSFKSSTYPVSPDLITSEIPFGNITKASFDYTVSTDDAKRNYVNAGTYTMPATIGCSGKTSDNKLIVDSKPFKVIYKVADMMELSVDEANPGVSLAFDKVEKYRDGTGVQASDQLRASATVPFDITVRANGDFISGNSTIPVSVLSIGQHPQIGHSVIIPVAALSTIDQKIVSNGQPVIDGKYSLNYTIAPEQARKLLGKKAGTYRTTLTYTITSH